MRPGESPDWVDALCAVTLHLTPAEYADALALADREGVSVEEIIASTTREVLLARFGGKHRDGNVVPFERPCSGEQR